MAKLNIGATVRTKQQVQNLISDLIEGLDEFSAALVVRLTINYLKNSGYKFQQKEIEKMVSFTLYNLQIEGKLVCESGIFVKVATKSM